MILVSGSRHQTTTDMVQESYLMGGSKRMLYSTFPDPSLVSTRSRWLDLTDGIETLIGNR